MGDGGPRRLQVRLPGRPPSAYPVLVAPGAWADLPRLLEELCPAHRYVVITDARVQELHAAALTDSLRGAGLAVDLLSFPPGEAQKTRETWAELSDRMLAAGVGRDGAVLAAGGGVVGDLAGFVAATYLRGVPLVQLPTTLLAMIDSSVGGKTGVDTAAGKNLIGAFHPPELVVADTFVLATLPKREVRAGLSEAVKHAAISDAAHLDAIERDAEALLACRSESLTPLILRSVEIKADVVARDELESGPRKALNFGHTIGHAIEALSGYAILHGEAISIGMIIEAEIGERMGLTENGAADRLRAVLTRLGSPTVLPGEMDAGAVLEATRLDKKARAGEVEYALLERIGAAADAEGRWSVPVPDAVVLDVLRR